MRTLADDAQTESTIRALERLATAAAKAERKAWNEARAAAWSVVHDLRAIPVLPDWLPKSDLGFYLGRAELIGGRVEPAEEALSAVPDDSVCAAEAIWLLAKILSGRITEANAKDLTPKLYDRYDRIVALKPLCPLAQIAAEREMARREASAGVVFSRWLHVPLVGTRYDADKLSAAGDLYAGQGLLAEAAAAFRWSAEVRSPELWLHSVSVPAWLRAAECERRSGNRALAARLITKCYGFSLEGEPLARVTARLRDHLHGDGGGDDLEGERPAAPDASKFRAIGDLLRHMELFDEALSAYRRAGAAGALPDVAVAETLEEKAAFSHRYRSGHGPCTVLGRRALAWADVATAYEEAKHAYSEVAGAAESSARGVARCDEALTHVRAASSGIRPASPGRNEPTAR